MGEHEAEGGSQDKSLESELPKTLRRDRIVELAQDRPFLSVSEVSSLFGVSEVTARSDMAALEDQGLLRRVRGGAVATSQSGPQPERPFVQSLGEHAQEKARLGEAAARLVLPGETIILDVGTTITAVAHALADRNDLSDVTVFTNGLTIALALEPAIPNITVVLTGGTLRPLQHSLVDPLGDTILKDITVDTAFLGCNGVHPVKGVTNVNLPEAAMKRRMVQAARRGIVVADGSKIGAVALAPLCEIGSLDLLLTDESADPSVVEGLRNHGLDVEMIS